MIGNPGGLQGTVSDGLISAFREDRSYIKITAPISSGSSGSPVLDEEGKVIGVAVRQMVVGQNLNFAIPVSNFSWFTQLPRRRANELALFSSRLRLSPQLLV